MRAVSVESAMRSSPPADIREGSLVEVRTFDRKTSRFRVTEITDEGLGGQAGFFRYADMESLKVDRPAESNETVMGYIFGALGIVALVWLVGNADNVSVCSPSPCPSPSP